jgi:hypothetical protein
MQKSVNSLAVHSSGKMMSVGRPPGLFVRCATELLCRDIGVLEAWKRGDLVGRGLWRYVAVVWTWIF